MTLSWAPVARTPLGKEGGGNDKLLGGGGDDDLNGGGGKKDRCRQGPGTGKVVRCER